MAFWLISAAVAARPELGAKVILLKAIAVVVKKTVGFMYGTGFRPHS